MADIYFFTDEEITFNKDSDGGGGKELTTLTNATTQNITKDLLTTEEVVGEEEEEETCESLLTTTACQDSHIIHQAIEELMARPENTENEQEYCSEEDAETEHQQQANSMTAEKLLNFHSNAGEEDDDVVEDLSTLNPFEKVLRYSQSTEFFDRQMLCRTIHEALRFVLDTPEYITAVLEIMINVSNLNEPTLRTELMEQVPQIAFLCDDFPAKLNNVVTSTLVPIVVRYLTDPNEQVRKTSQAALLVLLEQKLISHTDVHDQVCPVILDLTEPNAQDEFKTEAVALMSKMAPLLGIEMTERLFVERFKTLCADQLFQVRKVCASNFGEFSGVIGKDGTENILLPLFVVLCGDSVWGIRKACADVFMAVSNACSIETRRVHLAPIFVSLLTDQSRWVRVAAFQNLGPFISTFADSRFTGLQYKDGVLLVHDIDILSRESNVSPPFTVGSSPLHDSGISSSSPDYSCPTTPSNCTMSSLPCVSSDLQEDKESPPDINKTPSEKENPCFNELNYWRIPLPDLALDDLEEVVSAEETQDSFCSSYKEDTQDSSQFENPCLKDSQLENSEDEQGCIMTLDQPQDVPSTPSTSLLSDHSPPSNTLDKEQSEIIESSINDEEFYNKLHDALSNDGQNEDDNFNQGLEEEDSLRENVLKKEDEEEEDEVVDLNKDFAFDDYDANKKESINEEEPSVTVEEREEQTENLVMHWSEMTHYKDDDQRESADTEEEDIVINSLTSTSPKSLPMFSVFAQNRGQRLEIPFDDDYGYYDFPGDSSTNSCKSSTQIDISILNDMPQDIVPKILLEHYISMTDSTRAENVENEITRHCAFSLPAVAMTLGRLYWPILKNTYYILAGHMQWKVRRTLAFSIHELAMILGDELTKTDLLPVFEDLVKDLDEVRIGIVKHLSDFLRILPEEYRRNFLPRLREFLKADNGLNWRFRLELALQLGPLSELFTPQECWDFIVPVTLLVMANEKIACIRKTCYSVISQLARHMLEKDNDSHLVFLSMRLQQTFANATTWKKRQSYVYAVGQIIRDRAIPVTKWCEIYLKNFIKMATDRVPNIRAAVAKFVNCYLRDCYHLMESEDATLIEDALENLRKDPDRDVCYYSSNQYSCAVYTTEVHDASLY